MTRDEARPIAAANMKAFQRALFEHLSGRAPDPEPAAYGTRGKGWYSVEDHNFSADELHNGPCAVQTAFAYL